MSPDIFISDAIRTSKTHHPRPHPTLFKVRRERLQISDVFGVLENHLNIYIFLIIFLEMFFIQL